LRTPQDTLCYTELRTDQDGVIIAKGAEPGQVVASGQMVVRLEIWILVLFLIYVTASELNVLLGRGELYRILFARRSTEVKPPRR
jgi:hypothetical protein